MVALTGSSGFVGRAVRARLLARGVPVRPLVRRATLPGEAHWDPAAGRLDPEALAGVTAVVHLAGENLTSGPWTRARRQRLVASRVGSTTLLAETMAGLSQPPAVLITASAIGIYGDRDDEILTEDSAPGSGFLADLVSDWEGAAAPAAAAGIRLVHLRFGVILGAGGGIMARVLPIFRLGLGGPLGSGEQWMSWVSLPDAVSVIDQAIGHAGFTGPLNVTAPHPVRNTEFTRELATALRRPAWFRVPTFLLELLLGDLAREAVLASARVHPARLNALGFEFADPTLSEALPHLLGSA